MMKSLSRLPSLTPPPTILLSDHTVDPPITTHYMCGDLAITFADSYTRTKKLLKHPFCFHRRNENTWPCQSCASAFEILFWSVAGTLCDYFACFHAADSPLMQSIWFHLFDIWQDAGYSFFPADQVIEDAKESPHAVWGSEAAVTFNKAVRKTAKLIERALYGATKDGKKNIGEGTERIQERILHDPRGVRTAQSDQVYETGPWVSGLTGWKQFLSQDSPGVVDLTTRYLAHNEDERGWTLEDESWYQSLFTDGWPALPATPADPQPQQQAVLPLSSSLDPENALHQLLALPPTPLPPMPTIASLEAANALTTRYLPQPLLAILNTRTAHIRQLATFFHTEYHAPDTAAHLSTFDTHALRIPQNTHDIASHYSPIDGRRISYTLLNGCEPITRYAGWGDEDTQVEDPGFNLLDELVAICRGRALYEPLAGLPDEEDEEYVVMEDGRMFDVWAVRESAGVPGGGEGRIGMRDWGRMFEEWVDGVY